jgi:hypothetical protein
METKKPPQVYNSQRFRFSEDDGTRTRNHRIDSLNTSRYKAKTINHFRPSRRRGCSLVAQTPPSYLPT